MIFQIVEKIIISKKSKIFDFFENDDFSENSKIEKNNNFFLNFFLKIFFDQKKYYFRWFFLKFISWSRRIVLKQFLNAPGRLKLRKATRKKCWPNKFDVFLLCGRCMIPGGSGAQYEKNRERLFSKWIFDTKKIFFCDDFFSNFKYYIRAFQRAAAHCQTPLIERTARERLQKPSKNSRFPRFYNPVFIWQVILGGPRESKH